MARRKSPTAHFDAAQLAALPRRAKETWQARVMRFPMWIQAGEDVVRPWGCLMTSLDDGAVAPSDLELPPLSLERKTGVVLQAFAGLSVEPTRGPRRLPGTLELDDAELAAAVGLLLAPLGVTVRTVAVARGLDRALATFVEHFADGFAPMFGPKLSLDEIRAFAAAARSFALAAPWRCLNPDDLVLVEQPPLPPELQHLVVKGAGKLEYGLAFAPTRHVAREMLNAVDARDEQFFADLRDLYNDNGFDDLDLVHPSKLHPLDHDVFEDARLPTAAPDRYPLLIHIEPGGRSVSPAPATVRAVGALLQALAATTGAQLDSGRWSVQVDTPAGSTQFTFSLPRLLADRDTIADRERAAGAPLGAEALAEFGWSANGRSAVVLARQALALDPGCVSALILLGHAAFEREDALGFYVQAIAAAEHAQGHGGDIDDLLEALQRTGRCLFDLGRLDEALPHLLRVEAHELGPRYLSHHLAIAILIELGREAAAQKIVERHRGDTGVGMSYLRALLAFRRKGDCAASLRLRSIARFANPHMPLALREPVPEWTDPKSPPGKQFFEAHECAEVQRRAWAATPGALEWLD